MQTPKNDNTVINKQLTGIAIALLVIFVLEQLYKLLVLGSGVYGIFLLGQIKFILDYGFLDITWIVLQLIRGFSILAIIYFILILNKKAPTGLVVTALISIPFGASLATLERVFSILYFILIVIYLISGRYSQQKIPYAGLPNGFSSIGEVPTGGTTNVQTYLMLNQSKFRQEDLAYLQAILPHLPETAFQQIQLIQLKDPTQILIASFFAGNIGVDRFMLGDVGLGVFKLITLGGLGIWGIIDFFLVGNRARQINFTQVMHVIQFYLH